MKFDVGLMNNQPVATVVRQAQLAEELGYETVWITDSHLVCRELWDSVRIVAEPGGSAAFAALLSGAYVPRPGERVGVVVSGGNTTAVDFAAR